MYVTFDESGALTGAYMQSVALAHAGNAIAVTTEQFAAWTLYRASSDRKSLVLADTTPTLAKLKESLHAAVAAEWAAHAGRGVIYVFPDGSSDVIQTRTILDTTNVTGMVVAAQELKAQGVTDAVLGFRGESNITHPLTPQQMIDMGMAVQGATVATYSAKWLHDSAIDALTTVAAAQAYDVTTGWPE